MIGGDVMICQHCGKVMDNDLLVYCMFCGYPLKSTKSFFARQEESRTEPSAPLPEQMPAIQPQPVMPQTMQPVQQTIPMPQPMMQQPMMMPQQSVMKPQPMVQQPVMMPQQPVMMPYDSEVQPVMMPQMGSYQMPVQYGMPQFAGYDAAGNPLYVQTMPQLIGYDAYGNPMYTMVTVPCQVMPNMVITQQPVQDYTQPVIPRAAPMMQPQVQPVQDYAQPVMPQAAPMMQPQVQPVQDYAQPVMPQAAPTMQPQVQPVQEYTQPVMPQAAPMIQPQVQPAQEYAQPVMPQAAPTMQPQVQPVQDYAQPVMPQAAPMMQPQVQEYVQPVQDAEPVHEEKIVISSEEDIPLSADALMAESEEVSAETQELPDEETLLDSIFSDEPKDYSMSSNAVAGEMTFSIHVGADEITSVRDEEAKPPAAKPKTTRKKAEPKTEEKKAEEKKPEEKKTATKKKAAPKTAQTRIISPDAFFDDKPKTGRDIITIPAELDSLNDEQLAARLADIEKPVKKSRRSMKAATEEEIDLSNIVTQDTAATGAPTQGVSPMLPQ